MLWHVARAGQFLDRLLASEFTRPSLYPHRAPRRPWQVHAPCSRARLVSATRPWAELDELEVTVGRCGSRSRAARWRFPVRSRVPQGLRPRPCRSAARPRRRWLAASTMARCGTRAGRREGSSKPGVGSGHVATWPSRSRRASRFARPRRCSSPRGSGPGGCGLGAATSAEESRSARENADLGCGR